MMSKRVPYGFTAHGPHGHLTANTTVEDRKHRAELGETALRLLVGLGIGLEVVEKLNELPENTSAAEMVTELEGLLQKPAAAPSIEEPIAPPDPRIPCNVQCPNNDLFCDRPRGHDGGHEAGRQGWFGA